MIDKKETREITTEEVLQICVTDELFSCPEICALLNCNIKCLFKNILTD